MKNIPKTEQMQANLIDLWKLKSKKKHLNTKSLMV